MKKAIISFGLGLVGVGIVILTFWLIYHILLIIGYIFMYAIMILLMILISKITWYLAGIALISYLGYKLGKEGMYPLIKTFKK